MTICGAPACTTPFCPGCAATADDADPGSPSAEATRARAKEIWQREGEIEIDDTARVSRGTEAGAYVAAWVWVPDPETP
jgi:hypothetical protein